MQERMIWLDNLKAYGIILVIIGHSIVITAANDSTGMLMKLIYSFHMPLFFFISGYLFRPNQENYFYKKWKVLLLPYLIFQMISVVFINVFYYIKTGGLERDPLNTLLSVFYINGSVGWNSPLWFLIVLLIIELVFVGFNKLENKRWLQFTLVIASCIIGWGLSETGLKYPFGIHIVFGCFCFYYLGNITEKYDLLGWLETNKNLCVLLFFSSGIVLVINMIWLNGSKFVSVYDNYYGTNYFLFLLSATSGILFSVLLIKQYNKMCSLTIFGKKAILLLGTQYFLLLGFDKVGQVVGIYSEGTFYLIIKVVSVIVSYLILLSLWSKRGNKRLFRLK